MPENNTSQGGNQSGNQGSQQGNQNQQTNPGIDLGRIKNDDRGNSNIAPDKKSIAPNNTKTK